jgi:hypothetical protein
VKHIGKILFVIGLVSSYVAAQQGNVPQEQKAGQPQVRINYLNVCTPSDAETAEIGAVLDRLPSKPRFAVDYEISRGRSTMDENGIIAGENAKLSEGPPSVSRWVRIRKDFPDSYSLMNVQYSFSVNEDKVNETLVFRSREQKDIIQVSLSDSVVAPAIPSQVATMDTPVDRIRLERFGKTSVVLARCPTTDQSAYEPLFQKASSLLNLYRQALGVRRVVRQDLPPAVEKKKAVIPEKSKSN